MFMADLHYIGHFGGPCTPKALHVDLCVSPKDRKNDFCVATVNVPTYKGKVTRKGLLRIAEVMVATDATSAQVWRNDIVAYGWQTLVTMEPHV
jgi:hypothetical protein